jgi:GWxTD domain-containing protein
VTLPPKSATRDADHYLDDIARFQIPPGTYTARFEVSSQPKKKRGLAEFELVVPGIENGKLTVSDLFFFRTQDPDSAGDDPERFRKYGHQLMPLPERSIRAGDPIRFYFQLFGIGQRRHEVSVHVKDRFGHSVVGEVRDFGPYRDSAQFIEGIQTRNLPSGLYRLVVAVETEGETASSEREFILTGKPPIASRAFGDSRKQMLKLIGAESREAADQFSVLSKDDQAIFAHGFWLQHDEMLARTYVGLVTGWGRHEVRWPLLGALKHERTMMKRVDRTFGERLGTPDTLHIREARERLDLILDDDKQDPYALTADALLALEAGLLAEGEIYAKKALEQAPKLADAHNAIGLSQIGRKNWKEARSRFARASEADPDWRTPWLNTELAEFISGKGDEMEELARIQRAAIQDLSHPEVYYMGARLLERHKRLEESADAYARQIEVNPAHARARFDLGRVYFKLGEIEKATLNWRELMEALPEFRSICIYPLLDAYLASGETGKAQTVIAEELRTLSPEARARVEDISLVASPEDVVKLGRLPEESQPQFVRAFWQRLDPTPATPGNERLVEHHRRVIYAMQNFSMDGETWDRRGDVYIRYGEPRHISKRSDIRFETDREVVRVKDRLQTSLTPEAKEEIIARAGRYRTSARDIVIAGSNAERVEGNDFESIDFEMNPNRSFFVSSDDQGPQYVRGTEDLTQRGKTREHLIRGIPLFPVDGSTDLPPSMYPHPELGCGC